MRFNAQKAPKYYSHLTFTSNRNGMIIMRGRLAEKPPFSGGACTALSPS